MAIIVRTVATGRTMNSREGFTCDSPVFFCSPPVAGFSRRLELPAEGRISTLLPSRNFSVPSTTTVLPDVSPVSIEVSLTLRHAHGHCAADRLFCLIDHIDKRPFRTALNGRGRHDGRALFDIEQQTGIHELVREQRALSSFGKDRFEANGSGGGIDLIVDSEQRARR